ncbi:hypothetical protein [Streptomyces venezuelae]|uniref:hypothetical protein n=1 Tax=Streptomyces venezuelae TaxID=54571 RepID=UPI003324128D
MNPTSRPRLLTIGDFSRPDGARHPHHPTTYLISDPAEIDAVAAARRPVDDHPVDDTFDCMCQEGLRADHHSPEASRLLDPLSPDGIPARHRARWVAAAPAELREYARALAAGEAEPQAPVGVPPGTVFGWLGAVRREPRDAAWLLADRAPGRLLAGTATERLAWGVRETDRAGLEGAVRFFASEEFTTRHPKRRRVPDTARDILLRYARSHRPADLPVLERRLLRAPEDRIRRS